MRPQRGAELINTEHTARALTQGRMRRALALAAAVVSARPLMRRGRLLLPVHVGVDSFKDGRRRLLTPSTARHGSRRVVVTRCSRFFRYKMSWWRPGSCPVAVRLSEKAYGNGTFKALDVLRRIPREEIGGASLYYGSTATASSTPSTILERSRTRSRRCLWGRSGWRTTSLTSIGVVPHSSRPAAAAGKPLHRARRPRRAVA